jgi:hypothetical protein
VRAGPRRTCRRHFPAESLLHVTGSRLATTSSRSLPGSGVSGSGSAAPASHCRHSSTKLSRCWLERDLRMRSRSRRSAAGAAGGAARVRGAQARGRGCPALPCPALPCPAQPSPAQPSPAQPSPAPGSSWDQARCLLAGAAARPAADGGGGGSRSHAMARADNALESKRRPKAGRGGCKAAATCRRPPCARPHLRVSWCSHRAGRSSCCSGSRLAAGCLPARCQSSPLPQLRTACYSGGRGMRTMGQ